MFDKFLFSVMRDDNSKILILLVLIVYVFGITDLIPSKIRYNMKCPMGKLIFFSLIGVLSSNNFEMAILVTPILEGLHYMLDGIKTAIGGIPPEVKTFLKSFIIIGGICAMIITTYIAISTW